MEEPVKDGEYQLSFPDIDISSEKGDIRFICPVCLLTRTMSPAQGRMWIDSNGGKLPTCTKDKVSLIPQIVS